MLRNKVAELHRVIYHQFGSALGCHACVTIPLTHRINPWIPKTRVGAAATRRPASSHRNSAARMPAGRPRRAGAKFEVLTMSIHRNHGDGCPGADCTCPWLLDYRPQGLAGPRHRVEFPTKKAAERHQAATRVKVTRGEYITPEKIPTFGQAAAEWLRGKQDHHPTTVQSWRVHLRHLAKLDTLRLDRIDVATIERVRDELRAEGLSPKTISSILTTASAVGKLALRRKWATSNPAALAERPRRAVTELAGDEERKATRACALCAQTRC